MYVTSPLISVNLERSPEFCKQTVNHVQSSKSRFSLFREGNLAPLPISARALASLLFFPPSLSFSLFCFISLSPLFPLYLWVSGIPPDIFRPGVFEASRPGKGGLPAGGVGGGRGGGVGGCEVRRLFEGQDPPIAMASPCPQNSPPSETVIQADNCFAARPVFLNAGSAD